MPIDISEQPEPAKTLSIVNSELLRNPLAQIERVQGNRLRSFMIGSGFTPDLDSRAIELDRQVIMSPYYQDLERITSWIHGSFDRNNLATLADKLSDAPDEHPTSPFGTMNDDNILEFPLDYLKENHPEKYNEMAHHSFHRFGFDIQADFARAEDVRTRLVVEAVVNSALVIEAVEKAIETGHLFYGHKLQYLDFVPIAEGLGSEFGLFKYLVLKQHGSTKRIYDRLVSRKVAITSEVLETTAMARTALATVNFRVENDDLLATTELKREDFQTRDRSLSFVRQFRKLVTTTTLSLSHGNNLREGCPQSL